MSRGTSARRSGTCSRKGWSPWSAACCACTACPPPRFGILSGSGALEGLAVTLLIASPRRDAAVATLRKALSDLDDRHLDFSAHIDADLRFHLLLCQLSENSVLVDAWRHLEGLVRITILSDGDEHHSNIMSGSHHAPIVDAVEAGDVAQAVKVLQDHMMVAADRLAGPAASR